MSNLLAVLAMGSGQMENGLLSRGQTTVIGRRSERREAGVEKMKEASKAV